MQKNKTKKQAAHSKGPATHKGNSSKPGASSNGTSTSTTGNHPRNLLLTNAATVPLKYDFYLSQIQHQVSVTVRQQDDEATWPGGAIWDLGIVLASVCVACAGGSSCTMTLLGDDNGKSNKPKQYTICAPKRLALQQKEDAWFRKFWSPNSSLRWVELGCGVGLSGLVASAALRPSLMLLTDLEVVVQQVTQPNVQANQHLFSKGSTTQCRALPLCWGNDKDLAHVVEILKSAYKAPTTTKSSRRKKGSKHASTVATIDARTPSCADVVLIGDVAYQHKPGSPSHFDVLHQTLLKLLHHDSLVIFGTRIRMPASNDLLQLFRQDLEEVVVPPLAADEIDPASFGKVKHNMSIHFMRLKRQVETCNFETTV